MAARVAAHPLVARVAARLEGRVSAVGGVVRDAALGRPPDADADLDLVVEGDAVALARRLARALGAPLVAHPRFGTAAMELPHGGRVDLVSARRETYPVPGALPVTVPGTLADDLARRDFTVNAMALRIAGDPGELVDPHGGMRDLAEGRLRTLRPDAFTEDPSRLVRAARYAARLGLTPDADTERAARSAAPALDPGSARVADELSRLLQEPTAQAALGLLGVWGVPWIVPSPRLDRLDAALARAGAPPLPAWAVRLAGAVAPMALEAAALPGWARGIAREAAGGEMLAAALADARTPSAVDRLLGAAPPAAAVGALAAGAEAVAAWWERGRDVRLGVGGVDLVRAGVSPGPAIGRALAAVRAAVLDGRVAGADEQLALALRVARGGKG